MPKRFRRRFRALRLARKQIPRLIEDPWLAEGAARDHDGVAAGLALHANRVLGRLDVAVADDRNRQRLFDGGDLVPVRVTGVHLRARARMHASARAPASSQRRAMLTDRAASFVPAARSDGHREVRARADRAHDSPHEIEVP